MCSKVVQEWFKSPELFHRIVLSFLILSINLLIKQ